MAQKLFVGKIVIHMEFYRTCVSMGKETLSEDFFDGLSDCRASDYINEDNVSFEIREYEIPWELQGVMMDVVGALDKSNLDKLATSKELVEAIERLKTYIG